MGGMAEETEYNVDDEGAVLIDSGCGMRYSRMTDKPTPVPVSESRIL